MNKSNTKITVSVPKIRDKIDKYKELRLIIEADDTRYDEAMKPLREELDRLKQELIGSFSKTGLPSLRTSDDEYLVSYKKETEVVVTNEVFAFKWALKNNVIRIDRIKASKLLNESKEIPAGFGTVDKETISFTKRKTVKKEHE